MALVGIELETIVSEPDALTTRPHWRTSSGIDSGTDNEPLTGLFIRLLAAHALSREQVR